MNTLITPSRYLALSPKAQAEIKTFLERNGLPLSDTYEVEVVGEGFSEVRLYRRNHEGRFYFDHEIGHAARRHVQVPDAPPVWVLEDA